jgi:hypothetical protein
LTTPASPKSREPLLLYVATSPHAVSVVLVREQQEHQKKQLLVYYVSETLDGEKKFYIEMEKVAYAVVMASRKLKHYF